MSSWFESKSRSCELYEQVRDLDWGGCRGTGTFPVAESSLLWRDAENRGFLGRSEATTSNSRSQFEIGSESEERYNQVL